MAGSRAFSAPNPARGAMVRRALFVVPIGVVLIWLVITTGIALSFGKSRPEFAHDVRGNDARASANLAFSMLMKRPDGQLARQAYSLARQAVLRDPTVIAGYASLGMAHDLMGQTGRAERLFLLSNRLSRRDLATQLWLIEARVRRDDVPGALNHFDAAISTSQSGWNLLSPILTNALDDDRLVAPIAGLTARNRWWSDNFQAVVADQSSNLRNATRFFLLARQQGAEIRSDRVQALADRLVRQDGYVELAMLERAFFQTDHAALLRDGEFDEPQGLRPFQWELGAPEGATVERGDPIDRPGNVAVMFSVDNPSRRTVARQLVRLPTGSYRLQASARTDEADGDWGFRWVATCGEQELGGVQWSGRETKWTSKRMRFNVPEGCRYQWIRLEVEGGQSASRMIGWTDDISIVRLR